MSSWWHFEITKDAPHVVITDEQWVVIEINLEKIDRRPLLCIDLSEINNTKLIGAVSGKEYFRESPSDHYLNSNDGDQVESQ